MTNPRNAARWRVRAGYTVTRRDPTGWTVSLDQDRSASLLLRVWLEHGTEFRARLTSVETSPGDEAGGEVTVSLASSPSEVIEAMESWLMAFLGGGASTGDRPE
jgi:hypothetical protein